MAERRMFSKTIIDSDAFWDLSVTAQLLYFHLNMRADDDGFINNPKKIMNFIGANVDDMNALINQQFVIPFENGIVVIKDWFIHNYIRKDRYKPTIFTKEKGLLCIDESGKYNERSTNGQPMVDQRSTQVRIGKARIGKDNIDICSAPQNNTPPQHKYGEYKNVLLSDEELRKLKTEFPEDWGNRIERLSEYIASSGKKYKNHLATIRNWARKDKEKGETAGAKNERDNKSANCKYGKTY